MLQSSFYQNQYKNTPNEVQKKKSNVSNEDVHYFLEDIKTHQGTETVSYEEMYVYGAKICNRRYNFIGLERSVK